MNRRQQSYPYPSYNNEGQQSGRQYSQPKRPRSQNYSNQRANSYYNNSLNFQQFQHERRQYGQPKPPKSHNTQNLNARRFPDRWLEYDPLGKKISNTRLIAFKTPLKSNFFKENDAIRFEVENVITLIEESGSALGLVIDLTNTNRYYDSQIWSSRGIQYVKVRCPGHEVNRSEHLVQEFLQIVSNFFAENLDNGKIIGVHCTHGLNRTGYLICRYLIDALGWPAAKAIQEFEVNRGHQIERPTYISSLYKAEKERLLREKERSLQPENNANKLIEDFKDKAETSGNCQ